MRFVKMPGSVFLERLERYARLHRWLLAIVGCLPGPNGEYHLVHVLTVLALSMYAIVTTAQCIAAAWPDDIDQIAYNVTPFLAHILLSSKLVNFIIRRKDNYQLIRIAKEQFWHENITSPCIEQEVMERYARQVFLSNIVQSATMFSAAPMWLFTPVIEMFLFSRHQPFHRILPFNHWVPFGLDKYADPLYEILYVMQTLAFCLGVTVLTALDCLYVHLVMTTCAQFKILQMRIRDFDKDSSGTELSLEEQEKKIFSCIELHQQLFEYCDKLEATLTIALFVQFFIGVGFLCTAGFIMTMFPGNMFIVIQNVLCMSASLSELFLICYTANLLTTEGIEVAFAAYSSAWIDAPERIKKLILFMIMRSQRPIYLTVGKFTPVSVATFESITRTAASYFTVLTSMREEN